MINLKLNQIQIIQKFLILILMILVNNYTLINPRKKNYISLYLGLFEKSPTVLRKAIVTAPYSGLMYGQYSKAISPKKSVLKKDTSKIKKKIILPLNQTTFQCGPYNVIFFFKKEKFLPMKTVKKSPQNLLIIHNQLFFSTGLAA